MKFLTGYQNAAYAERYRKLVERVRQREKEIAGSTKLTEAVARYYAKLLAYKDEYEVARLHADGALEQKIAGMFEGDYKLVFHLSPPLLAKTYAAPVVPAFPAASTSAVLPSTESAVDPPNASPISASLAVSLACWPHVAPLLENT